MPRAKFFSIVTRAGEIVNRIADRRTSGGWQKGLLLSFRPRRHTPMLSAFCRWQNARLARRLLLFPKISLRCDFREPCLLTEWRNLARCVSEDKLFSPCSALLYRSRQDPSTDARDDRDGCKYSLLHPQFYILHSTFQKRSFDARGLRPRLLRMTERENGCSASFSVTLSSSSHAYAVSILPMAKCSTCKAAPPLPKNLAPLRFSGALFIDRVEKSCAVRIEEQARAAFAARDE